MMTLLYIPRFDESGAAPRYRVYQYLPQLRQLGINITIKPLLDKDYLNKLYFFKKRSLFPLFLRYLNRALYLTFNRSKFDMVFMDGELFPFVPFFIEKFFLPKHFIIDQDDAIFHTYDQHPAFFIRFLLGKKIAKIWQKSHHLIIGNAYTHQKAQEMGVKKITILPTVVDATLYKPLPLDYRPRREIVIGWVGSPTTISAMHHIQQALVNVARKMPIVLTIIGANYHLDGVKTICIDWKEGWSETEEIRLTNDIDIGIMPLEDGPYQKGKGGFKLIKYMACAKPMIASPVGVNSDIVTHGVNGFLAKTVQEWETYLLMLIGDAKLREEFGITGREKMLSHYSLQSASPIFCNIVSEALSNR